MKTTKLSSIIACAALSASALFCGCSSQSRTQIAGEGPIETRDTVLDPFTSLTVTTGLNVTFTASASDSKPTAHISAPASLMPYLVMEVKDGALQIGLDNSHNYRLTNRVDISISAPMAGSFTATSGSDLDIICSDTADAVTLHCTSGADIDIASINCQSISAHCTSGADIDIANLSAAAAELNCTSGADIDVTCANVASLSASATSGADIDIAGKVENLTCTATSGASIDASKVDKSTLSKQNISKNSSGSVNF
ncbi:MAG: DUF2807 domain-containing protein [Bacteroides sp.]|nr:DUF2807 domain-containing protein [Bacteroides sp.]MCM1458245.1 DUF2807 domain-containing protein [Lachnoclostridium sp.]